MSLNLLLKDEKFKKLMKMFPGRKPFELKTYLQIYRSQMEKGDDWYPDEEFRAAFTVYLHNQDRAARVARAKGKKESNGAISRYTEALQVFNHAQLHDAVDYLAQEFSDYITDAEEEFPGKSRAEIIDALGGFEAMMNDVIDDIKDSSVEDIYDELLTGNESEARREELMNVAHRIKMERDLIVKYKTHIVSRAAYRLGEQEGLKFEFGGMLADWQNEGKELTASDDDEAGRREDGESKGSRFVDFRELGLAETLSPETKRFLSNITMRDENGKPYNTIFGKPRKMDYKQVAIALIRVIRTTTPDTFMKTLEESANKYPWMADLHRSLRGNERMQAIIYGNCKRVVNRYSVVHVENSKYVASDANSSSKEYSMIRHMFNNMNGNILSTKSIYDGDGRIRTDYDFVSAKGRLSALAKAAARVEMRENKGPVDPYDKDNAYARTVGEEAMDNFFAANPDFAEEVAEYARGVGLDIIADDVKRLAYTNMPVKTRDFAGKHNRLEVFVGALSNVYGVAGNGKNEDADALSLVLTKEAQAINFALYMAVQDEVETRARIGQKTLSTLSNTNLTHQVIDILSNIEGLSPEAYAQRLIDEWGQYEGYTYKDKYLGWLGGLIADPSAASGVRFRQELTFNGVPYAELSDAQKGLSSFVEWLRNKRTYEFPIKADYSTAYDFLEVPFTRIETGREASEVERALYHSTILPIKLSDGKYNISAPIVQAFADEVLCEYDRIRAIEERSEDGRHVKLGTYEDRGRHFLIFPELDTNGFRQTYESLSDAEAYKFLMQSVAEQLDKVFNRDLKKLYALDMQNNPYLDMFETYQELDAEGFPVEKYRLTEAAMADFQDFSLNQYYARLQIMKLFTGGEAHFPSLTETEKRMMFLHAPHTSLYISGTQNLLYINDNTVQSAFLAELTEQADELYARGVITEYQRDEFIRVNSNLKDTDGIALRSMESKIKLMKAQGQWTTKHAAAWRRIKSGKPKREDIDMFLFSSDKLVGAGFEHIPAAAGSLQKPIKNPFLHKDSEMVLLSQDLMKYCLHARSAVMEGLSGAIADLKKKGIEVDGIKFKSDVKIGFHSPLDPLQIKDGKRVYNTSDKIRKYIVSEVSRDPGRFLHKVDWKYYGKAATMPTDVTNTSIVMPSQAVKALYGNIMPGDEIEIDGFNKPAEWGRDYYDDLEAAGIIEAYHDVQDIVTDKKELERIFQDEIANKGYSSDDMMYALSLLDSGDFAIPLCSLSVAHQVEQMLFSIISKRMTRQRTKGAHMHLLSPVGITADAVPFDDVKSDSQLSGVARYNPELKLRFKGEGSTRRMVGAESIMPFFDERLKRFADENGVIDRYRMEALVEDGTFPEELLQFYFLRTPSDDIHSITAGIIVGMSANLGGAGMVTAKEVDGFNGGDHDGDEVHVFLKDFDIEWHDEKISRLYRSRKEYSVRKSDFYMTEDDFMEKFKSSKEFRKELGVKRADYEKVTLPKYDFSKPVMDEDGNMQDKRARENAKKDLIFAQLTSAAGSRRAVMPNSNAETDVMAKATAIVKAIGSDEKLLALLSDAAQTEGIRINTDDLFNSILKLSVDEANKLLDAISVTQSPYSWTYSIEAYRRVMGGAALIDVYALYSSAFQMLQRAGLYYIPHEKQSGERVPVIFFGDHEINELFPVKAYDADEFASNVISECLQSAVDNNKNPILGYLNQTKELKELTFFLAATGMKKKRLHLMMNQPVMEELAQRLKARGNKGFIGEAEDIIRELEGYAPDVISAKETYKSLDRIQQHTESDYIDVLPYKYSTLKEGDKQFQADLLRAFIHLQPATSLLSEVVRATRPESHTATVGPTVAKTAVKLNRIEKIRDAVFAEDSTVRIGGLENIFEQMDEVATDKEMFDATRGPLHRVRATNSLMYDKCMEWLRQYFPQARRSWLDLALGMASRYSYRTLQEGTVQGIFSDMLTWKLSQNTQFIAELEARREELVYELPEKLKTLKRDIGTAKRVIRSGGEPKNKVAASLVNNSFLNLIGTQKVKGTDRTRILFRPGGPVTSTITSSVMSDWADLLSNPSEEIRQLAIDLYMYNFVTNGYRFGMYEFGHLAPVTVLWATAGYSEAMKNVLESDFIRGDRDTQWFMDYYYMNHWQDDKLVPVIDVEELPNGLREQFGLDSIMNDAKVKHVPLSEIQSYPYILIRRKDTESDGKKKRRITELAKVMVSITGETKLQKRSKLGYKGVHGQVTVQYDPFTNPAFKQPLMSAAEKENASKVKSDEFMNQSFGISKAADSGAAPQTKMEASGRPTLSGMTGGQTVSTDKPTLAGMTGNAQAQVADKPTLAGMRGGVQRHEAAAEKATANNEEVLAQHPEEVPGSFASDGSSAYNIPIDSQFYDDIYDEQRRNFAAAEDTSVDEQANLAEQEVDQSSADDPYDMPYGWDPWAGMTPTPEEAAAYEEETARKNMPSLEIAVDDGGKIKTKKFVVSPWSVKEARRQKAYVELNKRLREILRNAGIGTGAITEAEARMKLAGITDFDTAKLTAEGLKELIRLAEGKAGEYALPEEFAHVALEMLGHEHPLVQRLLSTLASDEAALREAFGNQYDWYMNYYEGNTDDMLLEAAGKLVAKQLLYEQQVKSSKVRSIIRYIVDGIKNLLRKIGIRQIDDAVLDSEGVASQLARDLLSGRLADDMSFDNIVMEGRMPNKERKDISDQKDAMTMLLKNELKRLAILKKRYAYSSKKSSSQSISMTEGQILRLEAAIRDHKTTSAILTYLGNAYEFLAAAEKNLMNAKDTKPANSVCKTARVILDTIYSYKVATKIIDEAVKSGEFTETPELRESINSMNTRLGELLNKVNDISMQYFQRTMADFYGEDGVDITIGKEKGRHISILEMTTKGDRDINIFQRWVHSMADCNDLVLKAISGIVRNAKKRARTATDDIQKQIVVAFDKLVQETGSKDQSFMFEYKIENGKKVRSGKYITEKKAELLPEAQKNFYYEMMRIKKEVDKLLPPAVLGERKIVMLRKTALQKAGEASDLGVKAKYMWEAIRNTVVDTSESVDYDYYEVELDFQGNRVDKLPILYTKKGKKETYDDMTDDVASSILAYAGMANEYYQLNEIVGEIENASYMSAQRQITQRAGSKIQRQTIQNDDLIFHENYTQPQSRTNIQKVFDDFKMMHVYGHLRRNEGTWGKSKVSKRKTIDMINSATSYSQLAVNLPQRIANVSVGQANIIIHAAGKGAFNMRDVLWATKQWMQHGGRRLLDTGATETDDKLSLFRERLDIGQENGKQYKNAQFKKSRLAKIFNFNLLYGGLMVGEDYLASATALAMARREKVLYTDKETNKVTTANLWDAYKVYYKDPVNKTGAYLAIQPGYTKMDGSPITIEDEYKFSDKVAATNFELQGIYNQDDKSAIQSVSFGALIIMYRKWIAPALKRRYSGVHYDAMKEDWEEGYWRTTGRFVSDFVKNITKDGEGIIASWHINQDNLTDYEKSNLQKALRETAIILGALISIGLLENLPPDDDKDKPKLLSWAEQMSLYQLYRLRNELGSQSVTMPGLMLKEGLNILESPFAAIEPIRDAINGLKLLWPGTYMEEVTRGPYKGHSKAYKYFWNLPVISMAKHIQRFKDPSSLISFYKNNNR